MAPYNVDVSWDSLEHHLERYNEVHPAEGIGGLDLNPDFQRGHVWTEDKQIAYVEFILRGGKSSKDVYFNHPNWMGSFKGEMVLVDGKQRIEAVRQFMSSKIKAFGHYCNEYDDQPNMLDASFSFHINNLKTRAEVLQWYLDLNTGGVVHTNEEIEKVKTLLRKEKKNA